MVTDAGKVQALCALDSEKSTSAIVDTIKRAEFLQTRIFLCMLPIEFVLACFLLRRRAKVSLPIQAAAGRTHVTAAS